MAQVQFSPGLIHDFIEAVDNKSRRVLKLVVAARRYCNSAPEHRFASPVELSRQLRTEPSGHQPELAVSAIDCGEGLARIFRGIQPASGAIGHLGALAKGARR